MTSRVVGVVKGFGCYGVACSWCWIFVSWVKGLTVGDLSAWLVSVVGGDDRFGVEAGLDDIVELKGGGVSVFLGGAETGFS